MTFLMRLGIVVVAAVGVAPSPLGAGEAAEKAGERAAVDELRKGLMAVLGDSFEYLGGEFGQPKAPSGKWAKERFWFARVRAKEAGDFGLSYTVTFEFPDDVKKKILSFGSQPPDRAIYTIPIRIGERGTPRMTTIGHYGNSADPANAGDTLILPIHVPRHRAEHTFADAREDPWVKGHFDPAESWLEKRVKAAPKKPVVQFEADARLELLASWGISGGTRSGKRSIHTLTAYMELKQPGSFNLIGRLADEDRESSLSTAFRVAPKDKPVTVVLDRFQYQERAGKFTSKSWATLHGGTREVRVGDRVLLHCGSYSTPSVPQPEYRAAVVEVGPFMADEAYTPEKE